MNRKKEIVMKKHCMAAARTVLVCAVCVFLCLGIPDRVQARTVQKPFRFAEPMNHEAPDPEKGTASETEQPAGADEGEKNTAKIRDSVCGNAGQQLLIELDGYTGVIKNEVTALKKAEEEKYLAAHPGIGKTVVLDPGHSAVVAAGTVPLGPGSTQTKAADASGTRGRASGLTEYQLTMSICQQLRKALEEEGYTVILTHETNDVPIDCVERARVANNAKADIFVRIHANGSNNSSVTGAMTICITSGNPYVPSQYPASKKLSQILLDTYCEETGINKQYVWETDTMTGNNWSEVPCTILEMGYMTNDQEDLKMADPEFQKVMVAAIRKGIDQYFKE